MNNTSNNNDNYSDNDENDKENNPLRKTRGIANQHKSFHQRS